MLLLVFPVGLVIVARSVSLNSFIISTVPVHLLINLPAAAWLFWVAAELAAPSSRCEYDAALYAQQACPAVGRNLGQLDFGCLGDR